MYTYKYITHMEYYNYTQKGSTYVIFGIIFKCFSKLFSSNNVLHAVYRRA